MKKDKVNLFEVIPYISEHITTEQEGELAVITFPRFRSKFMLKYFVPRSKSAIIRIKLEEHGTAVWQLMDGKRTVREIVELLSEHFNGEENYEYRITTYLAHLHKQGFIKYKFPVK